MISQEPNLLPLVTRRTIHFLGTATCDTNQCVSVGLDKGDLVLADQDGHMFRIPDGERLGVLTLIVQSLQT